MKDFKSYLTEKNRLMQKYEKGEIDILSYNIPTKKGKDFQYDNTEEILKALGVNPYPTKILNKFKKEVSKIPYGSQPQEWNTEEKYLIKEILNLNNSYRQKDFIKENIDFATGKGRLAPLLVLSHKNQDKMNEYYQNPKNLKDLEKSLQDLTRYGKYLKDFMKGRIEKAEAKLGIVWDDIVEGFRWIAYFRGASQRKIPQKVWPFLRAITVKPNRLPKTVYRGIFLDGKDVDENQDYSVGNKIKLNNKKATSWSTSVGQALTFSASQDFIKDEENGYQLVIKYDIQNPEDVIADFRTFKNMPFFNQQEIVISPKVKYGEIVYSKKGDDYDTSLRKTMPTKSGDSMVGFDITYYIENPDKIKTSNLSLDDKIKLKEIFNMTLGEVAKKYPEFGRKIKAEGCVSKVNAILAIPLKGYSDDIRNCSYNSLDLVDIDIYLTSELIKELQSFGLKIKNQWSPEVKIKMTLHYEIKIKGYASEVKVSIIDINIEPLQGENFEHNVKVASEVKKKILKSKNIEKYIPQHGYWKNLKVV